MKKIVVVGVGNVGVTYVNNIINSKGLVDEIVLIDIDRERILGEVMDLSHSASVINSGIKIKAGDYRDCFDADIVVIAAGLNQEKDESRLNLINRNNEIIKSIVREVITNGFSGIFLVVTNPVDIMTYLVRKYSNFPGSRVIGTGTVLDTERLRFLLSQKIGISTKNIHAYVVGEHGDSSIALWSKSTIGLVPIKDSISEEDLDALEVETKRLGYKIIDYKKETSYGVANCMLRITKAILNNENEVLNVSSPYEDIYIGLPSVINKDGIKGTMKINFDDIEKEKFNKSVEVIKNAIDSMEE